MKKIISLITILTLILSFNVFANANSTTTEITDAEKFKQNTLSGNTLVFPSSPVSDSSVFAISAEAITAFYNDPSIKYYYFSHGGTGVLTDKNNYFDFSLSGVRFRIAENEFSAQFTYTDGGVKDLTETLIENEYTVTNPALPLNTSVRFGDKTLSISGVKNGMLKFRTGLLGTFTTGIYEFEDIKDPSQWYYGYINATGTTGIMSGVGNSLFDAKKDITRAELCAMIVKATSHIVNYKINEQQSFSDVEAGKWYYDFIMKCASVGIVNGVGDGKFAPTAKATRQEIATMTVRLLKVLGSYNSQPIPTVNPDTLDSDLLALYPDSAEIMDFAKESVLICARLNIMNGDGTGFRAKSQITRSECAKIFYLVYDATNLDFLK